MRNSEKQKYGKVRHNHSKGTKFQDYCIDSLTTGPIIKKRTEDKIVRQGSENTKMEEM